MRDHPTLHAMPIVPGLWGVSAEAFARINREIRAFIDTPANVRARAVRPLRWMPLCRLAASSMPLWRSALIYFIDFMLRSLRPDVAVVGWVCPCLA